MEKIFSNPGFHHIAEKICWNLDIKSLQNLSKTCEITEPICENILDWLRKNLKIKFNHSKILVFAKENRKIRKLAVLVKTNMEQMLLKDSGKRYGLKMESSNSLDCLVILDQTHLVRLFKTPTQTHLEYAAFLGSKHMAMVLFEIIKENISGLEQKFTQKIIEIAIICEKKLGLEIVKVFAPKIENPIRSKSLVSAIRCECFEIIKVLLPLCNYQRDQMYVKMALKEAENQRNEAIYQRRNSSPEFIEIMELFRKFLSDHELHTVRLKPCNCLYNISLTFPISDNPDSLTWMEKRTKNCLKWLLPYPYEGFVCNVCGSKYTDFEFYKLIFERLIERL